jgi:hypothetical protein
MKPTWSLGVFRRQSRCDLLYGLRTFIELGYMRTEGLVTLVNGFSYWQEFQMNSHVSGNSGKFMHHSLVNSINRWCINYCNYKAKWCITLQYEFFGLDFGCTWAKNWILTLYRYHFTAYNKFQGSGDMRRQTMHKYEYSSVLGPNLVARCLYLSTGWCDCCYRYSVLSHCCGQLTIPSEKIIDIFLDYLFALGPVGISSDSSYGYAPEDKTLEFGLWEELWAFASAFWTRIGYGTNSSRHNTPLQFIKF